MPTASSIPVLPRNGPAREALRQKGQFWTPDWVADAMVAYALCGGAQSLFDPALGEGAFFRAARRWEKGLGRRLELAGAEIDANALQQARQSGLTPADLAGVRLADFVLAPPTHLLSAIVANPPYVRHHRLADQVKVRLHSFARALLGRDLDGRAGLQVFFLLRCLERLAPDGRLAFIVSADICEGVFAKTLWNWVGRCFQIEAVVTFEAQATPFPGVDTNAMLFLIRRAPPAEHVRWACCRQAGTDFPRQWIESGFTKPPDGQVLEVMARPLTEALATGLSRAPSAEWASGYRLADFAKAMRGIVTGDNDFFFLTRAQAAELGIPAHFLVPAIGRTRDVVGDRVTWEDVERLDASGRPTLLLSLPHGSSEALPAAVRNYLRRGERSGLPAKTLIATRRPWYKMETRRVPPFLFAYLGRRNARFIRNEAGVVPLTCLLCLYPEDPTPAGVARLWTVLSDPRTVANLRLVGKSYGGDAIKVEPRSLEQLPLPADLVEKSGLAAQFSRRPATQAHLDLFF